MPRPHGTESVETDDGHCVELGVFRPRGSPIATVLCLPAMGTPAAYYRPFAEELAERGFEVVAGDLRGQGTSNLRAGWSTNFGYDALVFHDVPAMIAAARRRAPDRPLFVVGHSLGGQVALLAAASGQHVDGIVLVGSGTVWARNWSGVRGLSMRLGYSLVHPLSLVVGHFPGEFFKFGGRQPRTLIRDWAYNGRTGRYAFGTSGHDFEATLKQLQTRVLALSLDGDTFAPRRSVQHLLSKLELSQTEHRHLDATTVDPRALHHFRWARRPAGIVDPIAHWLEQQSAQSSATRRTDTNA